MEISALVVKIETTIEVEKKELLLFQHLPNSLNLNRQNLLDLIPLVNANPSRHVLSRLLVSFNKDSRSIFDSISALHLLLSDKKYQFKQTAIHLLGSLELAGGDLVLSLFAESANIIVKIFKNATDLSLKNECLIALVKTIKGAGRGASDQTVKDLLKIAKTGLTDKILLIRSSCLEVTLI